MRQRISAVPVTAALIGLLGAALAGCTPWATYPPLEGAVEISNPGVNPLPELMARGIEYTRNHLSGVELTEAEMEAEPIVFNLPEGTPASVYGRIIKHLHDNARPMTDADESSYQVTAVRVRMSDAEVDVIHLAADGAPELVTLHFKQNVLKGYQVKSYRRWHYSVDMPGPHYVGPPIGPGADAEPASEAITTAEDAETPESWSGSGSGNDG